MVCLALRLTIGASQVGHVGSEPVAGAAVDGEGDSVREVDGRWTLCTSASNSEPAINSMGLPSAKDLASGVKSPVVTMMTAAA